MSDGTVPKRRIEGDFGWEGESLIKGMGAVYPVPMKVEEIKMMRKEKRRGWG